MENAVKVFSSDKAAKEANRWARTQEEEKEALEKKVCQLTIENDRLKKICPTAWPRLGVKIWFQNGTQGTD